MVIVIVLVSYVRGALHNSIIAKTSDQQNIFNNSSLDLRIKIKKQGLTTSTLQDNRILYT